jgi:broad specificity phosphatase PhoE
MSTASNSTDVSTGPAAPRPACGWVMLARHGEPALSRDVRLNAAGYRDWWGRYEEGGILSGQKPPAGLLDLARKADVIFASTRRRAIETAEAVVQGKHFVRDSVFIEAPLPPPPLPVFVRLNPRTWGLISRLAWWYFGHNEGQETRGEAEARARDVARRLIDTAQTGQNVLVLAHGFFNTLVWRELKRAGWRCIEGRGYRYWSARRFVRP